MKMKISKSFILIVAIFSCIICFINGMRERPQEILENFFTSIKLGQNDWIEKNVIINEKCKSSYKELNKVKARLSELDTKKIKVSEKLNNCVLSKIQYEIKAVKKVDKHTTIFEVEVTNIDLYKVFSLELNKYLLDIVHKNHKTLEEDEKLKNSIGEDLIKVMNDNDVETSTRIVKIKLKKFNGKLFVYIDNEDIINVLSGNLLMAHRVMDQVI